MDIIMVAFNTLIILLYTVLIVFITPLLMRFLKRRNYDLFDQLVPVAFIIFITSIAIAMGYGGLNETLFFKTVSIVSFIAVVSLLFLTIMMKKFWKEKYNVLISKILSFRTKNERSFSLK